MKNIFFIMFIKRGLDSNKAGHEKVGRGAGMEKDRGLGAKPPGKVWNYTLQILENSLSLSRDTPILETKRKRKQYFTEQRKRNMDVMPHTFSLVNLPCIDSKFQMF